MVVTSCVNRRQASLGEGGKVAMTGCTQRPPKEQEILEISAQRLTGFVMPSYA